MVTREKTLYTKNWKREHPELVREQKKRYRKKHRAEIAVYAMEYYYSHPESIRMIVKRRNSKRRELGFISLNEPFEGSEAHHIDKEHVLHIPKELHRSVSHNVWTGKNMDVINQLAFKWLRGW